MLTNKEIMLNELLEKLNTFCHDVEPYEDMEEIAEQNRNAMETDPSVILDGLQQFGRETDSKKELETAKQLFQAVYEYCEKYACIHEKKTIGDYSIIANISGITGGMVIHHRNKLDMVNLSAWTYAETAEMKKIYAGLNSAADVAALMENGTDKLHCHIHK